MGVSILGNDPVNQADQKKREFMHRGFLRSRAEAKRKGRKHAQTRSARDIVEIKDYK
jgi:hypothetical protein